MHNQMNQTNHHSDWIIATGNHKGWRLHRRQPPADYRGKSGRLVLYKTMENAQRAASNLNTVASTTAPPLPQINFWPDEAWDSEGNHWVQDSTGWHWHCKNCDCTEYTRVQNFPSVEQLAAMEQSYDQFGIE